VCRLKRTLQQQQPDGGDWDCGDAKSNFAILTIISHYDIAADMKISPQRAETVSGGSAALAILEKAPGPFMLLSLRRRLGLALISSERAPYSDTQNCKTVESSGGTAEARLFLRSPNRRRLRISADNRNSMADNSLQKTAKTARRAMRLPTPPAGSAHLMN